MPTDFNRITGYIDAEAKRKQLKDAMFPSGYPQETVALNFAANSIVAEKTPTIPLNKALIGPGGSVDISIKYGWRFNKFISGSDTGAVVIFVHGHQASKYDEAYTSSIAYNGNRVHGDRVGWYYHPSSVTNSAWKLPMTSGVSILEVSGWGQYLNGAKGSFTTTETDHTKFTNDLGPEAIGSFLYPVIVAINAVIAAGKVPVLAGHSGGGWATLLTAAIDPRVRLSLTHCGWSGIQTASQVGTNPVTPDGEQDNAEFYSMVDAHTLCMLGVIPDADGLYKNRKAHHIFNTSATNGDTVLPMTSANLLGLQKGGLCAEATKYGGELRFVGFDGASDPVSGFGASGTASYSAITNAVNSCLNSSGSASGADPGAFTYQGQGHHMMSAGWDYIVSQVKSL